MYWIIVPDTEENREYFVNLQNKLEPLFEQESILVYFTPVLNLISEWWRSAMIPVKSNGLWTGTEACVYIDVN
jgi:hypothetical protein